MENTTEIVVNNPTMDSRDSPKEKLNQLLSKRYKYEVSLIHICVITEDKQRTRLSVHRNITVEQLIDLIRKILSIEKSSLDWISVNEQDHSQLDKDKTLCQYNIKDGSKLYYRYEEKK